MAPDKRDAILDAALALFAERGFHGTAVPLVADRAGVGAGTIYRYFASKEELVNAVYQQWKLAVLNAITDGFPWDRPVREQFHVFFRRWVGFALDHPDVARFLELHHHGAYLDAHSHAIEQRMLQVVDAWAAEAATQRVVREASPQLLMAVVHGVYVGVVRAHLEGRLVLDDATIDLAETCAWEAIRS